VGSVWSWQRGSFSFLMKIKFVNNLQANRLKLTEGRNTGDAFAFCKKTAPGVFETIQPLSTCKDYLNDVVWSENTGGEGLFYGLRSKPCGCFGARYAYIAISILPHSGDPKYKHAKHEKLIEGLLSLCDPKRPSLLRQAEEALGIKFKTRSFDAGDGVVIAFLPRFWTKYMYLISLWSLLTRLDITYDGKLDLIKYMETYSWDDTYIVKGVLPKFKRILKGELPKQPMPNANLANTHNVHNAGAYSFNF